jgi:hypothetical protein
MGLASPNRPTKDNGTAAWVTGDTLNQTDVEGDFTAILDELDGNIENVNIATGAGIVGTKLAAGTLTNTQISATAAMDVSKLAQTAGQLDADIVDDYADDDATYATRTDPLESVATPSLPTNLQEEWERIRFVLARYGLGIATKITDGTNSAAWFDGLAIGPNLVPNGSFLDNQATPIGCTVAGAPATQDMVALPVTEGRGKYLRCLDAAGATTDGPSWTLTGLRGQTLYLVEARVLNTTAEVNLVTTGATGTLGDLDLLTNSADAHPASLATDWQTLAGLVETDATPTPLVVTLNPTNANYAFGTAYVSVREVAGSRDAEATGREHLSARGGNITRQASSTTTNTATLNTETTLTVLVPGDNYQVVVHGKISKAGTNGETYSLRENADVDGAGNYNTSVDSATDEPGESSGFVPLHYASGALIAGRTYGYRLNATGNLNNNGHKIVVDLKRMAD